jgi:hypothetical protein
MSEHQTPSVSKSPSSSNAGDVSICSYDPFAPAVEYAVDAAQRSILFWDVMRQRGNQYHAHLAETAPHVLDYGFELIVDGRQLKRPVNYCLVRVLPPEGVVIDPTRRPFVVVDPRAGHGPGIGGFKSDSEIGVVMKAGHPCYFVGFLPNPMPGQTIEDIACRGGVPRKGNRATPGGRRQTVRDRQLSSRLGDHDACVSAAGVVRPADHRRITAVLLEWCARAKSNAVLGRGFGRQLADRAHQRSRRRKI